MWAADYSATVQVSGLDIHDGAVTNVLLERGEALEGSSEAPGTRIAGVELASGGASVLTGVQLCALDVSCRLGLRCQLVLASNKYQAGLGLEATPCAVSPGLRG